MNLLEMFLNVLENESLISQKKMPIFVLSDDELTHLKGLDRKCSNSEYNTARYILMSDGYSKNMIWEKFQDSLNVSNMESYVFGTVIKKISPYKSWFLKRLLSTEASLKIFEKGKKTVKSDNNVFHCFSEDSAFDCDFFLDFGDLKEDEICKIPQGIKIIECK